MELGDWIDGDLYNGRIVRIANSFVFKEIADKITGECSSQSQINWDEMVRKYAIENASLNTMVTIKITDNIKKL